MEISLDPELETIVRQKVDAGEYPSAERLVEEALFLLVQRDWERTKRDLLGRIGGADLFPDPTAEASP